MKEEQCTFYRIYIKKQLCRHCSEIKEYNLSVNINLLFTNSVLFVDMCRLQAISLLFNVIQKKGWFLVHH